MLPVTISHDSVVPTISEQGGLRFASTPVSSGDSHHLAVVRETKAQKDSG